MEERREDRIGYVHVTQGEGVSKKQVVNWDKLQRVAKPNDMKLSFLETYAPGKMSHQKSLPDMKF